MYGLQGSVRPFDSTPLCVRSHVNEGDRWICQRGRPKACAGLLRVQGGVA